MSLKKSILLILTLIGSVSLCQGASENVTELMDTLIELDPCFTQSVYSFLYQSSNPPTTTQELENSCKNLNAGFKCLKDKSKVLPSLVKRGIGSFVTTRQRYTRKYCTNPQSEVSKQYVKDLKCIMDNRFAHYKEIDSTILNTLLEIRKRNYTDAAIELKYICCSLFQYRKSITDGVGPMCQGSKTTIEELINSIISSDINLICDDEEKLVSKVCPTLEPYKLTKKVGPSSGETGPSATIMYLVLTLGEPEL